MSILAAVVALRLMNPNDVAIEATMQCGEESHRVVLEAREVLDVEGCASASASSPAGQPLLALETSTENGVEWQTAIEPDAACAIPSMYAPLFACRNGTATAYVAPVAGVRYEWSAEGATILGGADTNRVSLQITGDKSVKLSCTVRTDECAAANGSGVILIREPIAVREFKVPAATNANEPLTITWSYLPGREPQSQILAGDLFPQPVTLGTSQRSYTFTPQTGGARTAELRASYARALSVVPRSKKRRRSASGAPIASECPAALATAKIEVRGCAESEPILNAPFDSAAGATFTVKVEIADGEKVEWSAENGTVQSVSPFYDEATFVAGTTGETKVTARVERKPGCFTSASASVAIILPANQCAIPPTATLTSLSHDCDKVLMHVTFTGNGPFAGEWSDGTPFRSSTSTGHFFTTPGTLTIENFRDSSCFGTVTGAKTVEQIKPAALLDATQSCGVANLVATLKGVPPFEVRWSDGQTLTTSETTLTRSVKGKDSYFLDKWSFSMTDATCKSRVYSRTIEVAAPPVFDYHGPTCQTIPGSGVYLYGRFRNATGPYRVDWSDGVSVVSGGVDIHRQVGPIGGASASYELVRAFAGSCEVDVAGRVQTVLNRPAAAIQPAGTFGCATEPLTATLSVVPLPNATIEWAISNNARILSGQGTPNLTFTADTAGKYDVTVKTTYPDGHCTNTSPKIAYTFAQKRTVRNAKLEPSTIKPGGKAIITWEPVDNPSVTVTTTSARARDLHQDADCCTAYFLDTGGVAASVPIYVQWYDPCLGSQVEYLTLTVAP